MSTADESDEDLKKAIALSLAENSPPMQKPKPDVIDLVSSDEDDDLDAPLTSKRIPTKGVKVSNAAIIDLEKSPSRLEPPIKRDTATRTDVPSEVDINSEIQAARIARHEPVTSSTGFLGLDRKQMEEERLRRAESRKRKEPPSPPQPRELDARQVKAKVYNTTQPAKHEPLAMRDSKSREIGRAVSPLPQVSSKSAGLLSFKDQERLLNAPGTQFPDGVVKRTWAKGCPREVDAIKLEEVLQKDTLELAVLSAFQVDPNWVYDKMRPTTRVIWVLQAKTEAEKQELRSQAPNQWRFCFPSMEGQISCMHSKLQILSHPTHLRVVVPSANLVPYDWGETGIMENICFLIDLPRLPEGTKADMQITEFGKELLHFIQAMGLDPKVIASMNKFDFSRTAHLGFVHSIGGAHIKHSWKRTGFPGLGSAVRNLGLDTEEVLSVDALAASIGSLSDNFIKSIYLAAQGDNGLKEYNWRQDRPIRSKTMTPVESKLLEVLKDRFRIYFPTRETVEKSIGGLGAAGTICFKPQWYDSDDFPRHLMRDCKSIRPGMLVHSKMLFVRGTRAWAYIGSANLSESAWGKLVKDKATKEPKLTCRNWECGVIVAVPEQDFEAGTSGNNAFDSDSKKVTGMEVFLGHIPVPMVVPGEEYGKRRPWFFSPK